MARIESLNILTTPSGKDFLSETYGGIIENVERGTISTLMKNKNLSGDPTSGTVEAKRIAFAKSKPYGTARTAGKGDAVKATPITVALNKDEELVEELEYKDTTLYGVEGLIQKRAKEQQMAMIRTLETGFFAEASAVATAITPAGTTAVEKFEEIVLALETTKNDFVNGVPRSLIHVVLNPATYSELRIFIDVNTNNASIDTSIQEFGRLHGVMVYSSIDLPTGVTHIGMVNEAIAQPVLPKDYLAEKINLSNAVAIELFYSYGTKAVMPDLIYKMGV